ncbi:MAG: glycosyltransferase [Bacteroidetes bacterium CG_4_9_14_3_um_filter_41_19]|nr:MAG: glycosyltransferase [Bacteroidetes bacterium CG_4_9_14_3_um_filter_41_19]
MSPPQINIIVPIYNEKEVFDSLIKRLDNVMLLSRLNIEVILIDDGSTDGTDIKMNNLSKKNEAYQSIFLSRNFGHQSAITTGLYYANATEGVMIIDADLQDPPEVLDEFYKYFLQGYDVVYAIRKSRKESWYKKMSYQFFYFLLKKISNIEIPVNSGDFSLLSKRAVDYLNMMPEESRYIRGMRSWIGFNQIGIEINRDQRHSGKPKYSLKKLLKLALNGIFNFSEYPIRIVFTIGLVVLFVSLVYFGYTLIQKVVYNTAPEGFTALLFTIILFGGIQLISLGLIGGYVIRIFFQVKNRPLFIVKRRVFKKNILLK